MNRRKQAREAHAADSERIDSLLQTIVSGTAGTTGEDFVKSLVQHTANALGVRYCFVAEFTASRQRVRTLALWSRDGFLGNVEYDLQGTPCEQVLRGEMRHYPEKVADHFPSERESLEALSVESYLAIPLFDSGGRVVGHLAVMDDVPMPERPTDVSVFRIFGERVAAELERRNVERALRASEARLSTILSHAFDGIVAIDEECRIVLCNESAAHMFRCDEKTVIGQSFDQFLTEPLKALFASFRNGGASSLEDPSRLWAAESLTALRADGEEFPIEVTLSTCDDPSTAGDTRLTTMILRDVSLRQQAYEDLARLKQTCDYFQWESTREYTLDDIVRGHESMERMLDDVRRIAPHDCTVMLLGETGVGKELVARSIHHLSERREQPLIKLNCAVLPSELIESELFGHEKGSFTGATSKHIGRFELADKGTLFLDEVGELSASAQAKLLRVLQDQEFERVGGSRTIAVDTRVIAATNRDLEQMVEEGTFRRDLFYRLFVFPMKLPALRERGSDIPLLANFFLDRQVRKMRKNLTGFSEEALEQMCHYHWPGNVRELQNVVERAAILAPGPLVDCDSLLITRDRLVAPITPASVDEDVVTTLAEAERRHISAILQRTSGRIEGENGAARLLDINPSTLRSRMNKLNIPRPGATPGSG